MTFRANEALLADRGLGVARAAPWPHVHPFLSYVNPKQIMPAGFKATNPAKFAAFLAATPSDTVFASSENFSFFFQPWAVDDLAAALKPLFDEVRIVVYLRRQDRQAVSHHQEGAKPDRPPEGALWGHGLKALPAPSPLHRLYLDYDHRLGMWENAFGSQNVVVRVFDRALLAGGDIVADVLALLGVSDAGLVRLPDRNVSLGRLQAKVGHIANATLGDDILTKCLIEAMPADEARMAPSAAEARAFLEPYRAGNHRLNARLKISAEADLFADGFSDYPCSATDVLDEQASVTVVEGVIGALGRRANSLAALSADDLRDAAQALRASDPHTALRLIEAAHSLRPTGPTILKLLAKLKKQVADL